MERLDPVTMIGGRNQRRSGLLSEGSNLQVHVHLSQSVHVAPTQGLHILLRAAKNYLLSDKDNPGVCRAVVATETGKLCIQPTAAKALLTSN
jgi:hypothetical protein